MKKSIVFLLSIWCWSLTSSAQQKPNVLVFLIDDLRPELGCYGNELIKTPNIDQLAADGVTFDKAYCQQGVCAPSRMSILTGKRVENIGIYSLFTPLRTVHPDMLTMPQFFKEHGYTTVSIGKVYHHSRDDVDSWSIHVPKEENTYMLPENQSLLDSLERSGAKRVKGPPFESADVDDEAYKDGRAAKYAIETLGKIKDDPFMMIVGMSKPHLPFNAPKKYWDLYDRDKISIPLKKAPKGVSQYALTQWNELRGYHGMPDEGVLNDALTKELIHGYYASVSYVDAQIGKILTELEALDLRKNTMVVVMSDHGWKLGEYGAWCKHSNFEIDTRVPLIISRETGCQKRESGVRSNALVENIDIFPTLADACGLTLPDVDGSSINPLLEKPEEHWDQGAYSLFARGKKIMGVTVTDGEWRYTEWRQTSDNAIHSSELYPCEVDFSKEGLNLIDEPKHAKTLKKMKALLVEQFPDDYVFLQNDN